ncbi:MAG: helix-turn-helix domain-containing protein [Clostridiales bacterium]|nr:helix-turn-helix domain-containing protein [Clostridiales bacterium]
MKLSMWIFADWLHEFHPQIDIKSGLPEIDTIRFFSGNFTPSPNALYVGKMRDLFSSGSENVICVHRNDILLFPTDDIEEILNSVLSAFDFYSKWTTQLLEAISSGSLVSDLLRLTEPVITQPIFVLDSSQCLLAMSSQYGIGDVDAQWDSLILNESSELSFLMEMNRTHPEYFAKKELLSYACDSFLPNETWFHNFHLGDTWIGVANIINIKKDITRGTLDLFRIFCSYVDQWFDSNAQHQANLTLDSILHQTLLGNTSDFDSLNRHLRLRSWTDEDEKLILLLRPSSEQYNIHNYLCRTLNRNFPSTVTITHNESICMLCNLRQQNKNGLFQGVKQWLKKSAYHGGYSAAFSDIRYIREYYLQAKITLDFCKKTAGELYDYENYAMNYLFSITKSNLHANVTHPAILTLQQYDKTHHTEFAETLYVYLKNERSQSATAKELHLHRNTLTYRLHRLRDLISCNLDDAKVRMHILVSYELLRENSPSDT